MTDPGEFGVEGTQLPSIAEKVQLLMRVRRRADGSRWRATDIRNDLLNLPGGVVKVDVTLSMIAKVINGRQPNPGPLLRAGLAELFDVPSEYFLPPVSGRIAQVAAAVHRELTEQDAASMAVVDAEVAEPVSADMPEPSWTSVARGLTLGVKRIAEGIAEELSLTVGQAEALLHLAGSEKTSVSIEQMAAVCEVHAATASRIADVLEDRGLLGKHPQELGDHRTVRRLALTDAAREIVARHTGPSHAVRAFLASTSGENLRTARELLAVLGNLADPDSGEGSESLGVDGDQESSGAGGKQGVA